MPAADPAWIPFASLAPLVDAAAAWLATYALHSTLLLAGTWLVTRRLAARRLAVQETVWKLALVGGLVTASLQLGLGVRPLGGAWNVGLDSGDPDGGPTVTALAVGEPLAAIAPGANVSAAADLAPLAGSAPTARAAAGTSGTVARRAAGTAPAAARRSANGPASAGAGPAVRYLALVALAGGLLAVMPLLLAHLRLRRRLRGRAAVEDGPLLAFLRDLERAARGAPARRPARLTATQRLATPIARGVVRGEICLPHRALSELAPAEQEGVVAHELAHLVRRDPAWLLLARAVEGLFFFQPLNRMARRRLVEIAEWRCDDWAAERTRRPLALARCLTEVAGWSLAGLAALPVPGIVDGSSLGRRVRRLLERPAAAGAERTPRWLRPAGAAALVLVAVAAPGVTRGAAPEGSPPSKPAPVVAATAVQAPETAPAPDVAATPAVAPEAAATPETPPEAPDEPVVADRDRREREERWERHGRAADREAERALDDVDEMIDDEIDRGLDGLDERLEAALAPLDGDLGARLEAGGEELGEQFEALEKEYEGKLDALGDQMEAMAEQMADLRAHAAKNANDEEIADFDFDLDFGPDFERHMEAFGQEMAALGESWGALAGHVVVDPGLGERVGELVRAVVPSPESLERIRTESERLRAEARALADQGRLTVAEKDRIRREARLVGELARVDEAKLAELAAAARQLADQVRPSAEVLKAMRDAQRQAIETLREHYGAALEAQRQAVEAQRKALETQRKAAERQRQERERGETNSEKP